MNLRIVPSHSRGGKKIIDAILAKYPGIVANIAGEDEEAIFIHDVSPELVLEMVNLIIGDKRIIEVSIGQD